MTSTNTNTVRSEIETKLLHILQIYPQVSTSMLQVAMNPLRASDWRPHLERLIEKGEVRRFQYFTNSPSGRQITRTVIQSMNPILLEPPNQTTSDSSDSSQSDTTAAA